MLPQAVTTVWGTKLGTTLLNGFNSTTDDTAYFRCLLLLPRIDYRHYQRKFLLVWSRTRADCS